MLDSESDESGFGQEKIRQSVAEALKSDFDIIDKTNGGTCTVYKNYWKIIM